MIHQDFKTFCRLSRKGDLIALTSTIPADLETPVSSFLKTAGRESNAFLLESAEQEERVGRFSILGMDPETILVTDHQKKMFELRGGKRTLLREGGILEAIRSRMSEKRLANPGDVQGFAGGFVGYLSYENVENFEEIQLKSRRGIRVPRAVFFLCSEYLIFDHFRKQVTVVALVDKRDKGSLKSQYRRVTDRIRRRILALARPVRLRSTPRPASKLRYVSNMTQADFKSKVHRIKEYIRAGDCIQVVLSQRFAMKGVRDDFQIYRALRSINPSPYMFYFRFGGLRLIGSSPEVLVKKAGSEAEVRPIAGTRPRGADPSEDLRYEEHLRKSRKEMAEHLMLVDLGRNDLGRVCRFDSVRVKNFARVERYSHVMHLVSDVTGKLRPGKNAFDLLRAVFPAGTVSGAPKIRAMQIINELEPDERGPYAGCLGYFSFTGDMDMCITIRTLIAASGKIYLQAGAGIVKDSNPAKEYQETVNKAKALMKALEEQVKFNVARYR